MQKILIISLVASAFATHTTFAQDQAVAEPQPVAEVVKPVTPIVSRLEGDRTLVSLSFDQTPLTDVIKAFRDATGANIISAGTNLMQVVSVRLEDVPWNEGLNSILDPLGMRLIERPTGSGIFVVEVKEIVQVPKVTKTFELEFARAGDVTNMLSRTFTQECTVAAFSAANVVIVTATEQIIAECEKILKVIDKPRRQVYIEARFAEMSAAAFKKLGLRWDSLNEWGVEASNIRAGLEHNHGKLGRYGTGNFTTTPATDGTPGTRTEVLLTPENLTGAPNAGRLAEDMSWRRASGIGGQISADSFRLTLSALEQIDGISVFSNPKIIVANEESALVDMTKKEPNVSVKSSRSGTAGDQLDVTTELAIIPGEQEPFVKEAFYSYGIRLKVVPRISASGQITVEIEPSVSDKIGTYKIAGVTADTPVATYPIIDMKRIQTVFTMQDGSTAVIGGLSRTIEDNIDSGIPYLRRIPWIGPHLFGWKSRSREQKEIVIFVTVGIADPAALPEDIGMPKNAILSREILSGEVKEPGDRTKEDILNLSDPAKHKAPAEARATTLPAPAEAATPEIAITPLLRN